MSEPATIRAHLRRRFETNRLVFWHDPDGEYAGELDSLDLGDVRIVRVENNEYGLKHRMLRAEPERRFLVYRPGPAPADIGNWLLDLELTYGVFTADRVSLVRQELGLTGEGMDEALRAHERFFRSAKRVQALRALLGPADDARLLRAKMSAVLLGQREHSLLEITRTVLTEHAGESRPRFEALADHGLDEFFWRGTASIYGYSSSRPSVDDFVLWLFREADRGFRADGAGGLHNIARDFGSLRYDVRSREAMKTLARRVAATIGYAEGIRETGYRDLLGTDVFEETEQRIVRDLARGVDERTVTAREVTEAVRQRQSSVWFDGHRRLYAAIGSASDLLTAIGCLDLSMRSFDEGLERYRTEWFRIDQLYRRFIHAARTAESPVPLEGLRARVERHYTNKFLYELGAAWQRQVDTADRWRSAALSSQTSFFAEHVQPVIRDGRRRAVVIVSDALRYEIADELGSRIRQEDRFDATLGAVLGVLPSYTQLGMAALLPHTTIGHSPGGDPVLVDGMPSNGTANRSRILAAAGGRAIQAEAVLALTRDELRELYQQHQVLYVFHDRIDATGDKPATETRVFEAAEETMRELVDLVKRLANANATNILITADHGFLFQHTPLADAFHLSTQPAGDEIRVVNRRYVLGRGLREDPAFSTFTADRLGLAGDLEVQVPKSVHRLRLPGAGSRFVHGGATLQEVVVPVLTVGKKRRSDTELVGVEVLPETDKITTGQLVVKLYQTRPVSEKVRPRQLRACLYAGDVLISDRPELVFDQESADTRDRYQNVVLLLTQEANDHNNRAVEFRLEEPIPNTSQWRPYARAMYTLRRSFTSDFDF
ncbi:uncharacterized protein (TIGR02687 family) [Actinoplanes campanulatus]|uniref:Uncharacterized protein (TIGR02687 family) n=1 Tax=Actinoplanes campanulatus TaxID=113559 RepID=A0A7W5AHN2_9ACTN|nr:BREX-1 system phosphatase PglZ type A [Actinoplanes campanulatus]MBB3096423.1 uncharacterized protein (TIGR02687 family) [Actinoplanes campanulatus]GGN18417.1 hypothetical protein GCM10010109_31470 [Actinoplanes campanulatus]